MDGIKGHERELRERKTKTELILFGANEISAKIWNEMPELWTEGKFSTGNFVIFKDIDMNEGRFMGEIHRPKVRGRRKNLMIIISYRGGPWRRCS